MYNVLTLPQFFKFLGIFFKFWVHFSSFRSRFSNLKPEIQIHRINSAISAPISRMKIRALLGFFTPGPDQNSAQIVLKMCVDITRNV